MNGRTPAVLLAVPKRWCMVLFILVLVTEVSCLVMTEFVPNPSRPMVARADTGRGTGAIDACEPGSSEQVDVGAIGDDDVGAIGDDDADDADDGAEEEAEKEEEEGEYEEEDEEEEYEEEEECEETGDEEDDFRVIYTERTAFQTIEILQEVGTQAKYGYARDNVCVFMDGMIQVCDTFKHIYHESFVHVPLGYLTVPVENVLIIGGGDGMCMIEALRYASVKNVVQLELDRRVPELIEKYFGIHANLPGKPGSDPRARWIFGDGATTIRGLLHEGIKFDFVMIDISETPNSDSVATPAFFDTIDELMKPTGIVMKNEEYHSILSRYYNEFLEYTVHAETVYMQTWVLASNETSLAVPNFRQFRENRLGEIVKTVKDPKTDGYRQHNQRTRRYNKLRVPRRTRDTGMPDLSRVDSSRVLNTTKSHFRLKVYNMSPDYIELVPNSKTHTPSMIDQREFFYGPITPTQSETLKVKVGDELLARGFENSDLGHMTVVREHQGIKEIHFLGIDVGFRVLYYDNSTSGSIM